MAGTKHEAGDVWVLGILSYCSEVGDVSRLRQSVAGG